MNPYMTIGVLKKALAKRKDEIKELQIELKGVKKELAWEKSRKFK